ncbi:MAG: GtrA family protein [Kordiimonadaceae bacterium]|nr:GtrA family protein [Kordiimonadaceae bacterium]
MGKEFIKFTAVGLLSTALHYTVLVIMVELISLSPVMGTMIGYICGAILNYLLNLRYTFRSDAQHKKALPKFILMVATGFIINTTIMYLFGFIPYLLRQIIATAVVFIWNFIVGKFWIFLNETRKKQ